MKLPKSFTTVTPLSKTLAILLFIALPFIGFCLGLRFATRQNLPVSVPTTPNEMGQQSWKTYTNNEYGYEIKYPTNLPVFRPGMNQDPTDSNNVIIGFSHDEPHMDIYAVPKSDKLGKDLKQIVMNNYTLNLKTSYKYVPQSINPPTAIKIGNVNAYEYTIKTNAYGYPDEPAGYIGYTGVYKVIIFLTKHRSKETVMVIHFTNSSPYREIFSSFKLLN